MRALNPRTARLAATGLLALALAPLAGAEVPGTFWKEGPTEPVPGRPASFADVAESLSAAVVNIQTSRKQSGGLEEFFERRGPRSRPQQATGSGFVISSDGYVVTNHHVVDGADRIEVHFQDGTKLNASVVGLDDKTDLGLLKVESPKPLPTAPLGNSDVVRVGDWVMAIGNPLGLDHTVTVGILSARGRDIHQSSYDDFLQTDASINPGNSGGPLIDMNGNVIGINTAIHSAGQGIGFAIPINMAKELLPQLRSDGKVTRGWLGVQIQRVNPLLARALELEDARGALVQKVLPDTPAERAKLEQGDVILEFGGQEVDDFDDLPRIVARVQPGADVDVIVVRDGKRKKLSATLDKLEEEETRPASFEEESKSFGWGFEAEPLTAESAARMELDPDTEGVVVSDVDPDSSAAEQGLRVGDRLVEVNHREVRTLRELEKALEKSDEVALLLVARGDTTHFIAVER